MSTGTGTVTRFIGIGEGDDGFSIADALALYLLRSVEPYSTYQLKHVKSDEELYECDALIGVGNVYDAAKSKFSHNSGDHNVTIASLGLMSPRHPTTTTTSFSAETTADGAAAGVVLSSAGLVYAHHGEQWLRTKFAAQLADGGENTLRRHFRRIYEHFIEVIDCAAFGTELPKPTERKHQLLGRVDELEEDLGEDLARLAERVEGEEVSGFGDFLSVAQHYAEVLGKMLETTVDCYFGPYMDAYAAVRDSMLGAKEVDHSGLAVILDSISPHDSSIAFTDLAQIVYEDNKEKEEEKATQQRQASPDSPQRKNFTSTTILTQPRLLIHKEPSGSSTGEEHGEKYRVRCLSNQQKSDGEAVPDEYSFPSDWVYGWGEWLPAGLASCIELIHCDGSYAVVDGRAAAIELARRLIDHWLGREPTVDMLLNSTNTTLEMKATTSQESIASIAAAPETGAEDDMPTTGVMLAGKGANGKRKKEKKEVEFIEHRFRVVRTPSELSKGQNHHHPSSSNRSQNEWVSARLPRGTASLRSLLAELQDKYMLQYHIEGVYTLCHEDLSLVASTSVTENAAFWEEIALQQPVASLEIVYAVPNTSAKSNLNGSLAGRVVEGGLPAAAIDPRSPNIAVFPESGWGLAEVLATAVIMSTNCGGRSRDHHRGEGGGSGRRLWKLVNGTQMQVASSSAYCSVVIGGEEKDEAAATGCYCFHDAWHHFTADTFATMSSLDIMLPDAEDNNQPAAATAIGHRLSCAGLAFALYGPGSIEAIIVKQEQQQLANPATTPGSSPPPRAPIISSKFTSINQDPSSGWVVRVGNGREEVSPSSHSPSTTTAASQLADVPSDAVEAVFCRLYRRLIAPVDVMTAVVRCAGAEMDLCEELLEGLSTEAHLLGRMLGNSVLANNSNSNNSLGEEEEEEGDVEVQMTKFDLATRVAARFYTDMVVAVWKEWKETVIKWRGNQENAAETGENNLQEQQKHHQNDPMENELGSCTSTRPVLVQRVATYHATPIGELPLAVARRRK